MFESVCLCVCVCVCVCVYIYVCVCVCVCARSVVLRVCLCVYESKYACVGAFLPTRRGVFPSLLVAFTLAPKGVQDESAGKMVPGE
jgi:hypothetical protein